MRSPRVISEASPAEKCSHKKCEDIFGLAATEKCLDLFDVRSQDLKKYTRVYKNIRIRLFWTQLFVCLFLLLDVVGCIVVAIVVVVVVAVVCIRGYLTKTKIPQNKSERTKSVLSAQAKIMLRQLIRRRMNTKKKKKKNQFNIFLKTLSRNFSSYQRQPDVDQKKNVCRPDSNPKSSRLQFCKITHWSLERERKERGYLILFQSK